MPPSLRVQETRSVPPMPPSPSLPPRPSLEQGPRVQKRPRAQRPRVPGPRVPPGVDGRGGRVRSKPPGQMSLRWTLGRGKRMPRPHRPHRQRLVPEPAEAPPGPVPLRRRLRSLNPLRSPRPSLRRKRKPLHRRFGGPGVPVPQRPRRIRLAGRRFRTPGPSSRPRAKRPPSPPRSRLLPGEAELGCERVRLRCRSRLQRPAWMWMPVRLPRLRLKEPKLRPRPVPRREPGARAPAPVR
jgi:hypothetical protein